MNKKDFLALCLLGINFLILITHIGSLPETIPIHFNLEGNPDGYGSKHMLWFLAGISAGVWLLFYYLKGQPSKSGKQGPQHSNKENIYVVETMNIGIQLIFLYITFQTIRVALKHTDSLNLFIMLLLFGILFFPLLWVYIKRKKS